MFPLKNKLEIEASCGKHSVEFSISAAGEMLLAA